MTVAQELTRRSIPACNCAHVEASTPRSVAFGGGERGVYAPLRLIEDGAGSVMHPLACDRGCRVNLSSSIPCSLDQRMSMTRELTASCPHQLGIDDWIPYGQRIVIGGSMRVSTGAQ